MLALPAVVDPRGAHLDHAGPRRHLPGRAYPLPTTRRLPVASSSVGVGLEVGPALGQQGHGQHLLGRPPGTARRGRSSWFGVTHRARGGVMD